MPIINDTSPLSPDPLEAILQKLNGTIAKVSKLRQSLGDLEAELSEIHQQCENEMNARIVAPASNRALVIDRNHDKDTTMLGSPTPHGYRAITHERISNSVPPGSRSDPNRNQQMRNLRKQEPKGKSVNRNTDDSRIERKRDHNAIKSEAKGHPTSLASIPVSGGSGSLSGVMKGGNSRPSKRGVTSVPAPRQMKTQQIQQQIPFQHPPRPRPPTDPFPFPKYIDLSSYAPEHKFQGHDWFIVFNPSPKVKRVLDVNLVHTLEYQDMAYCVKLSPDGKWLATGLFGTVQIHDVETGTSTCVLDHGVKIGIWSLCFSSDGKYLATGAADNLIRVWNIAEKRIHSTFEGHEGDVISVHFLANDRFVLSGSLDDSVRIWNVHDRTFRVLTIVDQYLSPGLPHGVSSVAISPDGRFVAVGYVNAVVGIWEVATGAQVQILRGHSYGIQCIAFMPDGMGLISGSWDETLKYWDVSGLGIGLDAGTAHTNTPSTSSSPCLINFTVREDFVCSTAVSGDGTWVVSGSKAGNILFWDARTGVVQCMLSGHKDSIMYLDLCSVENVLVTAGLDGQVRMWSYGAFQ